MILFDLYTTSSTLSWHSFSTTETDCWCVSCCCWSLPDNSSISFCFCSTAASNCNKSLYCYYILSLSACHTQQYPVSILLWI